MWECIAEHAGAYWLLDLVASYQPSLRDYQFQLWRLEVAEDCSATATMRPDLGEPAIVTQAIPYTDFPIKEFEFYCIDRVALLKSEY